MDIVWLIVKFIVYTFVLSALYRHSYNFIFFFARRPVTWIGAVGLLGILNIVLAYLLKWEPNFVSAVVFTVLILNLTPSLFTGKEEMGTIIDEMYKGIELPHGRMQSKIGLAVFALCSLSSYVLLFGKVCDSSGACTPIFRTLL